MLEIERMTNRWQVGGVIVEPGEEVEVRDGSGQEVDGVEAIAVTVDGSGVGGGEGEEIMCDHERELKIEK